jgi:hypothetical protein
LDQFFAVSSKKTRQREKLTLIRYTLIRYLREFKGREVMVSPELAVRGGGAASLGYVTETQVIAPSSGENLKIL